MLFMFVLARVPFAIYTRYKILASLFWLPVQFRIDFKIMLFVFKSLNGLLNKFVPVRSTKVH